MINNLMILSHQNTSFSLTWKRFVGSPVLIYWSFLSISKIPSFSFGFKCSANWKADILWRFVFIKCDILLFKKYFTIFFPLKGLKNRVHQVLTGKGRGEKSNIL